MGAVSRAIAEGQYHLACAEALAAGQPRPDRRPSCFFDPRHGMSVTDAYWTPPDGGPAALVPVCSACAHKLEQGIEPEMRKVEADGGPVSYVNAGFAPAYWGGFGFGPGLFTGFLLGQALAPHAFFGGTVTAIPVTAIPAAATSAAATSGRRRGLRRRRLRRRGLRRRGYGWRGFGGGDFGGGDFGGGGGDF